MTREEEQKLIEKIKQGDGSAFEPLVLENQKQVYNLALRMVGNEEDAFDISQDAFMKAFNSIGKFRGESKFSVWLYRLTTNVCLDFLRAKKRKPYISLNQGDGDDESYEISIPDDRFCPETTLEKHELQKSIHNGLQQLPEDYRSILLLREIDGLSYDEISDALKLEPGTVKSRLFRARKKLCSILSADGNIPEHHSSKKTKEV